MAFSSYLATATLAWIKGTTFPTALSNIYISIHTADPGLSGTNGDVTSSIAGSRAAVATNTLTAPTSSVGGGLEISNVNAIQLTNNAAAGGLITHFGIWNASTSGNFLGSGVLSSSVDVQVGDIVQFTSGALVIRAV